MTMLDRARSLASSATTSVTRRPSGPRPDGRALGVSAGWGAASAFAGFLACFVPVFAGWVAEARTSTDWMSTLSFSGSIWALAHRAHLSIPHDHVGRVVLAPLFLTLLAVVFSRIGAKAALSAEADEADDPWWGRPAAFIGGYLLAGLVITGVAMTGTAPPQFLSVVPGLIVVPLIGMAWALAKHADWAVAREIAADTRERIPMVWLRGIRPALEGAALFTGLGLLIVLGLALAHAGRIGAISGQLGTGIVGGVVLWVAQVAALPNLALYAGAWLTGGGVTLGTVTVGATSVKTGVLPLIPIMGATPGHIPAWAAWAPVVPVIVGGLIGWRSLRGLATLSSWRTKAEHAAAASALAALILLIAMWASTMGVGSGAMAYIGAQPLVMPLLVVELVVPAVLTALALHFWSSRRAVRIGPADAD